MIYFCLFLLLFSCSAPYYRDAAAHLQEGQFEKAEKSLAKADLPYIRSNESPLLLLSRGMVYLQAGKFDQSAKDFEKGLDAIDYYRQTSAPEIAAQVLLQDDLGAYIPPPFEGALARFYQALAFLHQGQEDNAAATLHYLENHQAEQNPLTAYLLATMLQRRGDSSNARVLLARLNLEESPGNVLIVHHRGTAPRKRSETAPISVVSAALVETVLAIEDARPALSTLVGVPVPVLSYPVSFSSGLRLDHRICKPTLSFNVAEAAQASLDKEMPGIAARAAARLLLRRGAVAAVEEESQPLMDIAMFISNAATRADTRTWAMLPSAIDLYHLNLEPGEHRIQIGSGQLDFNVTSKELALIEIFQPASDNLHFITKETPCINDRF
jgi:uncharacterized protein